MAHLLVETGEMPMHSAVLTVMEGAQAELTPDELLERLREHVRSRLHLLPELRRSLHGGFPGRLPLWKESSDFRLEDHVLAMEVVAPGGDSELLAAATGIVEGRLDRSRPLWELWLLTGLDGGRWGTLLKVHHALADGYGMLRMVLLLFEGAGDLGVEPAAVPRPSRRAAVLRPALSVVMLVPAISSVMLRGRRGRRADLLRRISARRRLAVVKLDLAGLKAVAHAHEVKLSDVQLELAAAGVRRALVARGRPVSRVALRAILAVGSPMARRSVTHNRAASIFVSLPLDPDGALERLLAIAADSRRARRWQWTGVTERTMVLVARTHLGGYLSRHQRLVDLAVTNVVGPPTELRLLGDTVVEAVPVAPISGNVTINFCALSYRSQLVIGIQADARAWPDLPVVAEGMRRSAAELTGALEPIPPPPANAVPSAAAAD